MANDSQKPKVCLVDYYLDGYYHHWEEIDGKNFPVVGSQHKLLDPEKGEKEFKVIKISPISEDEYHVMLSSETE